MKHTREFYEGKALEALDNAVVLLKSHGQAEMDTQHARAQVYATLASAANDEHTHHYPHKLVEQLPWEERPRAAKAALKNVPRGKTTITGEKLQKGDLGPSMDSLDPEALDRCAAESEDNVRCVFMIHRGRHSWEAAGQTDIRQNEG